MSDKAKGKMAIAIGGWSAEELKEAQEEQSNALLAKWEANNRMEEVLSKPESVFITRKRAAENTLESEMTKKTKLHHEEKVGDSQSSELLVKKPPPPTILGKRPADTTIIPDDKKRQKIDGDISKPIDESSNDIQSNEATDKIIAPENSTKPSSQSNRPIARTPESSMRASNATIGRDGWDSITKRYISREEKKAINKLERRRKQALGAFSHGQQVREALQDMRKERESQKTQAEAATTAHIASATTRDLLAKSKQQDAGVDAFTATNKQETLLSNFNIGENVFNETDLRQLSSTMQKPKQKPTPKTELNSENDGDLDSDTGNPTFTITPEQQALMTKAASGPNATFTPEEMLEAELLLPILGYHARRKLRKRLGIPPPDNNPRPGRKSTARGYHGGTPKGRKPKRGIPDQPRGPKQEEDFDCRDGMFHNCPPDCFGRRHPENHRVEQSEHAKKRGTLMIGKGVEIGTWMENRGEEGEFDRKREEKEAQREKSRKGKEAKGKSSGRRVILGGPRRV